MANKYCFYEEWRTKTVFQKTDHLINQPSEYTII